MDYFKVLGLREGSSVSEINTAYRNLALKWHPDKNKDIGAEEQFKLINEAKTVLLTSSRQKKKMRKLTCRICGKVFNNTAAQSLHRFQHLPKSRCIACKTDYSRPDALIRHQKTCKAYRVLILCPVKCFVKLERVLVENTKEVFRSSARDRQSTGATGHKSNRKVLKVKFCWPTNKLRLS